MKILIALILLAGLGTGCDQRQAAPPQITSAPTPLPRTVANFRTVTTNMTLQQVIDRFGMYDRVRGSGIAYHQFELPDGTAVLISTEWPFQPTNRIQSVGFYKSTNEINELPLYP
jgi:hypothetical protein